MRIGIISDTHGWFHPNIPVFFQDVDLILHAGDVGTMEVLDSLKALAPVRAVYGNVDGWDIRAECPEHNRFELEGLRFHMTHIAGRPGRWQRGIGSLLAGDSPDIFICGHSHILQIERVGELGGMLFINPGAAGRQGMHQVKTCIRMTVSDGKAHQAEVIHLDEEGGN